MTNPLLDFSGLPLFDRITPANVTPAVEALLADANAALEKATAPEFPAEWAAMSATLDVATERLGRAWGAVSHLNSVADTPELRAAYNAALPLVTEFYTRLGADERLYAKYKAMDPARLNAEQTQARTNALRGFVLGGAELQGEAKERFAAIQERQAQLSQQFSENSLDATDSWSYFAAESELDGLPDDVKAATRAAAEAEGQDGHKLNLKLPCYFPVMQYATSSALRERLYRAYTTRASDQAVPTAEGKTFDNTEIIRETLALRAEEAALLGYDNFAQVSLVPKMAQSPDEVVSFLRDLARRARPYAERDLADLREFAAKELGLSDPQPWDWTFIGEKLKIARYSFSDLEVKQYFPAPKVLAGLFKIIETLFEVVMEKDSAPVWHESVEFYRITRPSEATRDHALPGKLLGQFYLDQPARNGKRGGAWMDDVRARWLRPDTGALQTPVAHLVCNFPSGTNGQPATLTHDDVTTLFHEFGHGLHHLLTQVNERDVSGISGVEWDAVELPSQFMENFCWEWGVLKHMTAHVQTGEPLPRALFDKMVAAKNYQTGLQTLRQIEFSLFDMLLHQSKRSDFMTVLNEVRAEVAVLPAPAYNRMAHTFGHIFSGGYAAGYYSYKWAELLSSDAYGAFEETASADADGNPLPSLETGRRYRKEILEAGGSRPAMESFKAFRGREPQIDAMLRHQGMVS